MWRIECALCIATVVHHLFHSHTHLTDAPPLVKTTIKNTTKRRSGSIAHNNPDATTHITYEHTHTRAHTHSVHAIKHTRGGCCVLSTRAQHRVMMIDIRFLARICFAYAHIPQLTVDHLNALHKYTLSYLQLQYKQDEHIHTHTLPHIKPAHSPTPLSQSARQA